PAVHLYRYVEAGAVNHIAQPADLVKRGADEGLAPKSWIYRHNKNIVDKGEYFLHIYQRRRWIDRHPRAASRPPYLSNRPMQVYLRFYMNGDHRRSCAGKLPDIPVRVGNHQVAVKRELGDSPRGPHYHRADRDIGHEMPIHNINMDQAGSAALGRPDLLTQASEIRGQYRWSDFDHFTSERDFDATTRPADPSTRLLLTEVTAGGIGRAPNSLFS